MRHHALFFLSAILFSALACGTVTVTGDDFGTEVPTIAPTAAQPESRATEPETPRNPDGLGLPATFTPAPTLPVPTLLPPQTTPTVDPASIEIYVVRRGDTLKEIADSYGVTVAELAALNGIENIDLIEVGQQIQIPIR